MSKADSVPSALEHDFAAVGDLFGGVEDPDPFYRDMRSTTPVMVGDILAKWGVPSQADGANSGRQVFTLFKYDDVMRVLRDAKTYSSGLLNDGLGKFMGGFLITAMDDEEHKLARTLLAPAFSASTLAAWRIRAESVLNAELIAPLTPKKRSELIADLLLPAPVRVIYEIIGYPNDPQQVEQFATWGLRMQLGAERDPARMEAAVAAAFQAAQDIYDHTLKIVRARRAEGDVTGDDLIAHLLRANYDGRVLTDDEIVCFLRQLLPAAAETTTRSFGNMLVALLERPALLERVRGDRTLVSKVVDEGMRWCTAAQFLARQCVTDVEIRGVKIPAGAAVSLACGSANHDEDVFDNPDEFDIDRKPRPAVGFGFGAHMCIGQQVAKMEMASMLNAMLDSWPNLRLDPDAPPPKITGVQLRGPRAIHVIWD
jgi:cytochrome P450